MLAVQQDSASPPAVRAARPAWVSGAVLPFLISRAALLVVALISFRLPIAAKWVEAYRARGWAYSPIRLLDVWGRWDTDWYLGIVLDGYRAVADAGTGQSNLAFFPLYPLLVKLAMQLLPTAARTPQMALALGVLVSNVSALGAVLVLHRHVRARFGDLALADRAVVYLLAFPIAFLLSCAYTEATFLFLAVSAWHLAWLRRWLAAGLVGMLLALCRASGVLAVVPLFFVAFTAAREGGRLRPAALIPALWLLLVPVGFVLWGAWLWRLSGDPLAVLHVQRAWGRGFGWPWQTLFYTRRTDGMTDLDRTLVIAFCLMAVLMVRWLSRADAVWTAVMLAPILFSGTLMSSSRFTLSIFPAFVLLGRAGKSPAFDRGYLLVCLLLQGVLFTGWSRFQWMG